MEDGGDFVPPEGDAVGLRFRRPYTPPSGAAVGLGFRYVLYHPPLGNRVGLDFRNPYTSPAGDQVGLNFTNDPDEAPKDDQFTFPPGWHSGAVGQPGVRNASAFIGVQGWISSNVGTAAKAWNYSQGVACGAIPPRNGYGVHAVWLYTRYLVPPGPDAQRHGTQWASHYLRHITSPGAGDALKNGTLWVSRSPRTLEPPGVKPPEVMGSHVVGGTRRIFPVGTEMTQWGTRIIPQGQVIYTAGFAGQVGDHDVQLYTRYVRPDGFATNADSLRFGYQHAWNLRQYLQQDYDSNDGLSPPPFGQWTGIENRDKEPGPVGWLSERHGYTSATNKASAMLPGGIEPPAMPATYKAGSVTHQVRPLQLDGWDSADLPRWAAVFNTADLLRPGGTSQQAFGQHALENRSRLYDKVGNFDTMAPGTPMIAPAIRGISFEQRYSIEPPPLALPDAKLHMRYVEYVSGGDRLGVGEPALNIRWTFIAPRWAFHPPAWIGEPALRNVTPELRTGGMNHEEFGQAVVRTQWRRVETLEGYMTQWGRPIVRDRRHWVEFVGAMPPPNVMPGPVVTKVGGLPDPQNIIAGGMGPGIEQVPKPAMNFQSAVTEGLDALRFGATVVTANSIRVEPGIWERKMGAPAVGLKNRQVDAAGIPPTTTVGGPVFSPLTIWAVYEAPDQAKLAHPNERLHYVDHDPISRASIKGPGAATIALKHRVVRPSGFAWPPENTPWPRPSVENRRHYIRAEGFNAASFGVPSVPGLQSAEQFKALDAAAVGIPALDRPPYVGPLHVGPAGIAPPVALGHVVEFRNRERGVSGWHSLAMGASMTGDKPFMWQGLRVGQHIPNIVQGFNAELYGTPWVSLRVRDLPIEGWDSFVCEYALGEFDRRMRVRGTPAPQPPTLRIGTAGAASSCVGAPSTRIGTHYIRPDGNSDQHRKGAPQ